MTSRIVLLACAVVAVLAFVPRVHAADLVVVEARGVDLKPGAEIDGNKPLALKDGQVVTLISPSGEIIKLHGPSDAAPAPAQSGSTADVKGALRTLVTQELADNAELGVVRGAADDPVPPEPWLIDVTHDGNRCLPENNPIVFWRPGGGGAETISIAPYDRSWLARAEWQAGADRLSIASATVPLRSRSTYVIRLGDKEAAVTIIRIPSAVSNDAMRAAWMIEVGCVPQVKALLQAAR
ncbi:MAG TPA: hypothetical protein VH020_12685 [Stellaceae bacterium]|jgi:hypothetical protein|nr:hypothetical protein [Stellaceae bacterium]